MLMGPKEFFSLASLPHFCVHMYMYIHTHFVALKAEAEPVACIHTCIYIVCVSVNVCACEFVNV